MTDAMHWSPDPPERPEPWLRIDLAEHANDPDAAREAVERRIVEMFEDARLRCDGEANEQAVLSGRRQPSLDGTVYKPIG